MNMLSEEDARNIMRYFLTSITNDIDRFGKSYIMFSSIEKMSDPVKREGNTPDVFCKIAEAAFEYGLSTDMVIGGTSGTMLLFNTAGPDYREPSPQICEEKWKLMEEKLEEMRKKLEKGPLELKRPPYVVASTVKKLDDLPKNAAIYILRVVNTHRAKGEVDEFVESVLTLEVALTDIGDLYTVFSTFGEHLFIMFDKAHYFQDEPEFYNLIGKTVFEAYPTEVDPRKIKKLEDLTKNDAIRLIRVLNSFRRKDMVDIFLSTVGDFESIYELFQLYISYIFHEYENANYFLDEPELDPKEKEFQTIILNRPTKFEGEFD